MANIFEARHFHPRGLRIHARCIRARVCEAFTGDQLDNPEEAIGIIFSFLNTRISAGEINDVRNSLRKSLRDIWPAPRN